LGAPVLLERVAVHPIRDLEPQSRFSNTPAGLARCLSHRAWPATDSRRRRVRRAAIPAVGQVADFLATMIRCHSDVIHESNNPASNLDCRPGVFHIMPLR